MDTTPAKETVLIAGASSGIGLHLARQFAKHGHPLVLVAPIEDELERIAIGIRTEFNADVEVIGADLSEAGSADEIWEELSVMGTTVGILCNNAGLGRRGKFWEIPLEDDIKMLRVNAEAVVRMTKRFLPRMLSLGRGRILNTASVAGFEPGPSLAVYHATKAFVLSFSEALATELKDTGVTVTALCPGPGDTDFFPKADMIDPKVSQSGNVMSPQEVAETAYKAVMDGERVIVPGGMNKAMVFARRILPEGAQAKQNEKMYEETHVDERKRERGAVEGKAQLDTRSEGT